MADARQFWMTSKREDGNCRECKERIALGDRIVYDIVARKAYCSSCGEDLIGQDPIEAKKQEQREMDRIRKERKMKK